MVAELQDPTAQLLSGPTWLTHPEFTVPDSWGLVCVWHNSSWTPSAWVSLCMCTLWSLVSNTGHRPTFTTKCLNIGFLISFSILMTIIWIIIISTRTSVADFEAISKKISHSKFCLTKCSIVHSYPSPWWRPNPLHHTWKYYSHISVYSGFKKCTWWKPFF